MNQYIKRAAWTEMQQQFVELAGSGVAPVDAARRAGSTCPNQTASEWMELPHIRGAIFKMLRTRALAKVEWKALIEKAKQTLNMAMDLGDVREAVAAAGKCLDVATKIGEETLASKAGREDAMASLQQLAEQSLGKQAPPTVVIPTPSGDKETEH